MALRFSIRTFDQSIRDAYALLFPGEADKSADQLSWRFERNPHGPGRFAIAEDDGQIRGMIALLATRLSHGTETKPGFQAIDTVVHPSLRGRGVFVGLGTTAQDFARDEGAILWGFPNANAAPGWFGRLGWSNFGQVPLLMRPLRSGYILGRLHPALRRFDVALQRSGPPAAAPYSEGRQLEADGDRLWSACRAGQGLTVDRSGSWLRWRLAEKPATAYRSIAVHDGQGEPEALVASRVSEKHGGKLCYVMEALSRPGRNGRLAQLLRSEVALAAGSGAELALAWCPRGAPNYPAYRSAGFLPVPPRLRPIEIHFGAHVRPDSSAAAGRADGWYISFLDSDTN